MSTMSNKYSQEANTWIDEYKRDDKLDRQEPLNIIKIITGQIESN